MKMLFVSPLLFHPPLAILPPAVHRTDDELFALAVRHEVVDATALMTGFLFRAVYHSSLLNDNLRVSLLVEFGKIL